MSENVIFIGGADEAHRINHKWSTYGVTHALYMEWYAAQHGQCLVCGADWSGDPTGMAIDHDHKTGRVRGLLCSPCNVAIGLLKDDPARCLAAAEYLQREPLEHVVRRGGKRLRTPLAPVPPRLKTPRINPDKPPCPFCGRCLPFNSDGMQRRHRMTADDPTAPKCPGRLFRDS